MPMPESPADTEKRWTIWACPDCGGRKGFHHEPCLSRELHADLVPIEVVPASAFDALSEEHERTKEALERQRKLYGELSNTASRLTTRAEAVGADLSLCREELERVSGRLYERALDDAALQRAIREQPGWEDFDGSPSSAVGVAADYFIRAASLDRLTSDEVVEATARAVRVAFNRGENLSALEVARLALAAASRQAQRRP